MFKSQLQEYAQKAGLPAPIYDVKRAGPSHEPQFKASVTIQGNSYESPTSFGNLKKAEQAAAEVALTALGKTEKSPLHESGLCKNLLQEYAQKCKLPLPVYSVEKTGEMQHSPSFIATVEIAGVHYNGRSCKTKKEAEIKAASAALVAIYADSGAAPTAAIVDEAPAVQDDTKPVEINSVESKPGAKRKRLFKGGTEVRKQKVEDEQREKIEETGNGDLVQAGDTQEAHSSLLSGSVSEQERLGSKAGDTCTVNGKELTVQSLRAQGQ